MQLPEPLARAGVRRPQRAEHARRRRDLLDRPKRGRVRRHPAEQRVLLPDRSEVSDARAAIGKRRCQVGDHPAGIMTTTPLLDHPQVRRQRAREPSLSATWATSALPGCDTRPAPSAVTSTVTERP